MEELQGRGYLIAHTAGFLREKVSKSDWAGIEGQLSPELKRHLSGKIEHAGWYPISLLNELTRQLTKTLGHNDTEASREALFQCGKYVAAEATNTFLKIFLKILTPNIFVKKLPDVFKRDFTSGRLVSDLSGSTLSCRYYELPNFEHIGALGPGFTATALETMGKQVQKIVLHDWSLEAPCVEGAGFELTWKD